MLSKIQLIFKNISNIVEETENNKAALKEIMEELGIAINSKIVFINDKDNDKSLNLELKSINKVKANIDLENAKFNKYNCLVVPIFANGKRLGTILAYNQNYIFKQEDIFLMEISNVVLTLIIKQINSEEERQLEIAKNAISILSYSELESIFYIFNEINGEEGLLVASKVADNAGITRSVIGNCIRKFESAGVIETRSLGVKGTFIKIVNSKIIEEINKMRI